MTRKIKPASPLLRFSAFFLSLIMTLLLLLGTTLIGMHALLTDRSLHEKTALDSRIIDAQMVRMEAKVSELAKTYHFSPETVLTRLSRQSLEDYNRSMMLWWTGLFLGDSDAEAPDYNTAKIQTAVRNDPLFQQHNDESVRLHVSRDQICYSLSEEARKAAMPLRMSLVELALPFVMEQISLPALFSLMQKAGWLLIALCGLPAALLLLFSRSLRWLSACIGSVLQACALVLLVIFAGLQSINLPAMLAELSPGLSLQFSVLGGQLMLRAWLLAALLLAAGTLLGILGRRKQRIRYVPRHRRRN